MDKIVKLTEKQKYLIKELSELTNLYKHLVKEKGENEARQWKFTLDCINFYNIYDVISGKLDLNDVKWIFKENKNKGDLKG
jgi:hypothetical protein